MKDWFKAQSFDVRAALIVVAIYGLVYLTITVIEIAFGVAI